GHCLPVSTWLRRPSSSAVFPYTTLFRSTRCRGGALQLVAETHRGRIFVSRSDRLMATLALAAAGAAAGSALLPSGLTVFGATIRSEEHTSELQSRENLVCRLLLEKKKAA